MWCGTEIKVFCCCSVPWTGWQATHPSGEVPHRGRGLRLSCWRKAAVWPTPGWRRGRAECTIDGLQKVRARRSGRGGDQVLPRARRRPTSPRRRKRQLWGGRRRNGHPRWAWRGRAQRHHDPPRDRARCLSRRGAAQDELRHCSFVDKVESLDCACRESPRGSNVPKAMDVCQPLHKGHGVVADAPSRLNGQSEEMVTFRGGEVSPPPVFHSLTLIGSVPRDVGCANTRRPGGGVAGDDVSDDARTPVGLGSYGKTEKVSGSPHSER